MKISLRLSRLAELMRKRYETVKSQLYTPVKSQLYTNKTSDILRFTTSSGILPLHCFIIIDYSMTVKKYTNEKTK